METLRFPSPRLKAGGRPPLELQLWSRLGCFGVLQDSQLSAQGRRTTSFGATTLVSAWLLWNIRIPSSFPALGSRQEDNLLWSYNFGLGSAALESFRIPSSRPKVGGRPPLELQLWSRLGCFGNLKVSQPSTQGRRTTSFGATTLVSTRLLWSPSGFPALSSR